MAVEREDIGAGPATSASVLHALPLPTIVVDPEGCVQLWNPAAERLLGWPAEAVVGCSIPGIPEEERAVFELQLQRALDGEIVTGVEARCRTKEGATLLVRRASAPLPDDDGQILGVVLTVEDVSERAQSEEALRGQAALLDLIFDAILVRDFETDRITFWNPGAEDMYGFTQAEALGQVSHDLLQTVHPVSAEQAKETLVRTGHWEGELTHTTRDGRQIVVASRWALQRDGGEPAAILETNSDVTERVREEQERLDLLKREQQARTEAEEARRRLSVLVDASSLLASSLDYEITLKSFAQAVVPRIADWCAVHVVDENGAVRQVVVTHPDPARVQLARELERSFPYDPDAPTGVPHVLRTGRPELISEIPEELLESATPDPGLLQVLRGLGLKSSMVIPLAARGHMLGAITFVSAESGRRYGPADVALAEVLARRAALAIDNARLYREAQRVGAERSAILAQMADGVAIMDTEGEITFLNDAALRMAGGPMVEQSLELAVEALQIMTVDGEPYPLDGLPLRRALRERETIVEARWRLRRPDGVDVIMEGSAAPVIGQGGELLGAVSTFRDVTAQVTLEQQKDDFLSAAAHDLRTPLTSLKGLTQILQRRSARPGGVDPEQLRQGLERIDQNASRMSSLINELLDLSRLQMGQGLELNRRPVDLVSLTRRCVAEQQEMAPHQRLVCEPLVPELVGSWDTERLERVISNLLSNATKYSPGNTLITVGVSEQVNDGTAWGVVSVQDRGIGIPREDLSHIFQRFHRARNVRGETSGTGIGLAGARQIVEQHGGRIEVRSVEGVGSTFTVYLPVTPVEADLDSSRDEAAGR